MRGIRILITGFVLGYGSLAAAQNIGQLDPLLENQRQQELEQRTNELGSLTVRGGAPDPGPAQASGGPCFQINNLTIEGVTILPSSQISAITQRYAPSCMEGADIQAVMRDIDAAYAEQGYITTKTYIPAQNLTTGSLILTVIEGHVDELILLDGKGQVETARGDRQLATAFPGVSERPFQLRDFEQGLDQMNRLSSVEAVLQLQPGSTEGGSHAIIQRIQKDRFRGYVRADTFGAESTGERRLSLETEVDDLFGSNDAWTFGYVGSRNTNALNLRGSVPYGYLTYNWDLSYSEYLIPLNNTAELFGTSYSARFDVNHIVNRDQYSTTEINAALDFSRSGRWINDVRLKPQNLTVLDLLMRHMKLGDGSRQLWDLGISFGLPILNADENMSGDNSTIPKAQFAKLAFGWQRQAAFHDLGTLVTDLRGQYSPHTLYSEHQLSLGSWSTVRGYTESSAAGDSGFYLRNDLYVSSDIWAKWLPETWRNGAVQKLQPHLFIDGGVVRDHARKTTETVAGLGVGASWYGERVTASALIGFPAIEKQKFQLGDPVFQLRLDVKAW